MSRHSSLVSKKILYARDIAQTGTRKFTFSIWTQHGDELFSTVAASFAQLHIATSLSLRRSHFCRRTAWSLLVFESASLSSVDQALDIDTTATIAGDRVTDHIEQRYVERVRDPLKLISGLADLSKKWRFPHQSDRLSPQRNRAGRDHRRTSLDVVGDHEGADPSRRR